MLTVFVAGMTDVDPQTCTVGNRTLTPAASGSVTGGDCRIYTTVLFDVSTSVPKALRQTALNCLETVIVEKSAYDAVRLATFGEQVTVLQDYTTDRYDLVEACRTIQFSAQQSRLYDAVYQSLSHGQVQEELPALFRTIVISDGIDDTTDGITAEELLLELQDGYYPVDVVAISPTQTENRELAAIARVSGGRYTTLTAEDDPASAAQSLSLDGYSYVQMPVPQVLLDGTVRQISVGGAQANVMFPAVAQTPDVSRTPEPSSILDTVRESSVPASSAPKTPLPKSTSSFWSDHGIKLAGMGGVIVILILLAVLLGRRSSRKQSAPPTPAEPDPEPSPAVRLGDEATVHITDEVCYTIQLRDVRSLERVWNLPLTDTLTIGRAEHCQVRLTDRSVSREQCKLAVQNGGVMLIPLTTTNRTICNGNSITEPWPLQPGDLLKFGHEFLRVEAIQSMGVAGSAIPWGQPDADKTETLFRENTK